MLTTKESCPAIDWRKRQITCRKNENWKLFDYKYARILDLIRQPLSIPSWEYSVWCLPFGWWNYPLLHKNWRLTYRLGASLPQVQRAIVLDSQGKRIFERKSQQVRCTWKRFQNRGEINHSENLHLSCQRLRRWVDFKGRVAHRGSKNGDANFYPWLHRLLLFKEPRIQHRSYVQRTR